MICVTQEMADGFGPPAWQAIRWHFTSFSTYVSSSPYMNHTPSLRPETDGTWLGIGCWVEDGGSEAGHHMRHPIGRLASGKAFHGFDAGETSAENTDKHWHIRHIRDIRDWHRQVLIESIGLIWFNQFNPNWAANFPASRPIACIACPKGWQC